MRTHKGNLTNSLRNKEIKNYHHRYHLQWVIYHSCSSLVSCSSSEWLQQIQLDSWPQKWEIMCFWWSLPKHGDGMFVTHAAELLCFYHKETPHYKNPTILCFKKNKNLEITVGEATNSQIDQNNKSCFVTW